MRGEVRSRKLRRCSLCCKQVQPRPIFARVLIFVHLSDPIAGQDDLGRLRLPSSMSSKAQQHGDTATGNGTGSVPAAEDRIYIDNTSLSELKSTCDEAVERVRRLKGGWWRAKSVCVCVCVLTHRVTLRIDPHPHLHVVLSGSSTRSESDGQRRFFASVAHLAILVHGLAAPPARRCVHRPVPAVQGVALSHRSASCPWLYWISSDDRYQLVGLFGRKGVAEEQTGMRSCCCGVSLRSRTEFEGASYNGGLTYSILPVAT